MITDPANSLGSRSKLNRADGAGSPQEDREIVIGREPRRDEAALRAIQDKWREILSLEPDGDIDDLEIVVRTDIFFLYKLLTEGHKCYHLSAKGTDQRILD